MKKLYYIPAVVLLLLVSGMNAQNSKTQKADRYFEQLEYPDAIKAYLKLVDKGQDDTYVHRQLALAYRYTSNTREAAQWYGKVVENTSDAEDYFWYAQMLNANGRYGDYKTQMQRFAEQKPNDIRARMFLKDPDFQPELKNAKPKFALEPSPLNSENSDFGVFRQGDVLYFTSSRSGGRTYGWNEEPTLDIYKSSLDGSNVEAVPGDVNTKFNEGTLTITADGKTMYFTRINYVDGSYQKDESGVSNLKIFRATYQNGSWGNVEDLSINAASYSTGHPALSSDERTLYFVSDRPGGYGGTDLYKVAINDNGTLGRPENLGATINTPADEQFPFIDAQEVLYFSSNGHLGLGGLDVFAATATAKNTYTIENLGVPVNSAADDFAFTYDPDSGSGYVSSNRGGSASKDAIYTVTYIEQPCYPSLMVQVTDAVSGQPLSGVEIAVNGKQYNTTKSSTNQGTAHFDGFECSQQYSIRASKEYYTSVTKTFQTPEVVAEEIPTQQIHITLQPAEKEFKEDKIILDPIYFEFDKSDIRTEASIVLDRLVTLMKKYPKLKVEVQAHTDTQGSDTYNLNLSQRRADAVAAYVVSKGVSKQRIHGVGYGEQQPLNDCKDKCSDEEHAQNRRSEFIITDK